MSSVDIRHVFRSCLAASVSRHAISARSLSNALSYCASFVFTPPSRQVRSRRSVTAPPSLTGQIQVRCRRTAMTVCVSEFALAWRQGRALLSSPCAVEWRGMFPALARCAATLPGTGTRWPFSRCPPLPPRAAAFIRFADIVVDPTTNHLCGIIGSFLPSAYSIGFLVVSRAGFEPATH